MRPPRIQPHSSRVRNTCHRFASRVVRRRQSYSLDIAIPGRICRFVSRWTGEKADLQNRNIARRMQASGHPAEANAPATLPTMIRALLFAFGLVGTLIGAGLFYVDTISLKVQSEDKPPHWVSLICSSGSNGALIIDPAEWLPYTLVGMGGLTVLYSIALQTAPFRHPSRHHDHH